VSYNWDSGFYSRASALKFSLPDGQVRVKFEERWHIPIIGIGMVYCSLREITYSSLGAESDCLATKYILAVTSFWKTDFF